MKLGEIVRALERIAPTALAEEWDNVGLLVGDPAAEVERALLAIDYAPAVVEEARAFGAELVVAYHPPIFSGLKRLGPAGSTAAVWDAIRRGVALYSPHTALDAAPGGTNDMLADVLGLGVGPGEREALRPRATATAAATTTTATAAGDASATAAPIAGLGRIGTMAPTSREEIFDRIRAGLGIERLLVAGPTDGSVARAAACPGACGDLLDDALRRGAELYLTGELRHHDVLRAARLGMTVVCALHSNSERAVLGRLRERMAALLPGLRLGISQADRDPFHVL